MFISPELGNILYLCLVCGIPLSESVLFLLRLGDMEPTQFQATQIVSLLRWWIGAAVSCAVLPILNIVLSWLPLYEEAKVAAATFISAPGITNGSHYLAKFIVQFIRNKWPNIVTYGMSEQESKPPQSPQAFIPSIDSGSAEFPAPSSHITSGQSSQMVSPPTSDEAQADASLQRVRQVISEAASHGARRTSQVAAHLSQMGPPVPHTASRSSSRPRSRPVSRSSSRQPVAAHQPQYQYPVPQTSFGGPYYPTRQDQSYPLQPGMAPTSYQMYQTPPFHYG